MELVKCTRMIRLEIAPWVGCTLGLESGYHQCAACPQRDDPDKDAVPVQGCSGCGGNNALAEIAMARTSSAMDQAILDA